MKSFKDFLKEAWIHTPGGADIDANYVFSKGGIGDPDSPTARKETFPVGEVGHALTTRHNTFRMNSSKFVPTPVLVSSAVHPTQRVIHYVLRHATTGHVLARATSQVHDDPNEDGGDPRLTSLKHTPDSDGPISQMLVDTMIQEHRNKDAPWQNLPPELENIKGPLPIKVVHAHRLRQIMNDGW